MPMRNFRLVEIFYKPSIFAAEIDLRLNMVKTYLWLILIVIVQIWIMTVMI